MQKNQYTQIGRSGNYKILAKEKKQSVIYMKVNYPQSEELFPTDIDHIVASSLHELIHYNRKKARCVVTSKRLNTAKEYGKKG